MEKNRELEEYWSNKAEELGEQILMRSISHTYYRGIPDTFGILYASERFLVYEYAKKSQGQKRFQYGKSAPACAARAGNIFLCRYMRHVLVLTH